ncbi:MAG: hypothetical protein AAF297_00340 [Planctomycetota bacterium]
MDFAEVLHDFITNEDVFIPTIIATVVVLSIVAGTIGKTTRNIARERTKREIAAYIAEGSMTPEQGERLIKSGKRADRC